jgi:threonine dehydratase
VIAGQGTIGLEMLEARPDLDTILVPLSGGGLAAGVALAAKSINPAIRVIGITMDRGAAMHASLAAGRPVEVEEVEPRRQLGGGIGLDNRLSFRALPRPSRRHGARERGGDLPRHAGALFRGPHRRRGRLRRGHRRRAGGQAADAEGPRRHHHHRAQLDMAVVHRIMAGEDVTLGDLTVKGPAMAHDIRIVTEAELRRRGLDLQTST